MQTKKNKQVYQVHIFTDKTCMKFIPTNFKKTLPKPKSNIGDKNNTSVTTSRFSLSSIFRGSKSTIQSHSQS